MDFPKATHLFLFVTLLTLSKSNDDEHEILLTLPATIHSSATPNPFTTWTTDTPPCNFTGVSCDPHGPVLELDLSNQHLTGTPNFTLICALPFLKKLALGFNSLSGSVTADINKCSKLRYLDLGSNDFSGRFPEVPSLRELRYLYLNTSGYSGEFPWNSLRNMPRLVVLSIGNNLFDKSTFPEEVLDLLELKQLFLSNCSLQGRIPPGIGRMTNLINLELAENNITGEIPSEIGNLVNLWQLELYNNKLTGNFPVGMRNLSKLENFDASSNHLEGDLSELKDLTNLVSLVLYRNNLSGEIPVQFGDFPKLVELSLYTNRLSGPLPEMLGSRAEFDFIDVSENLLTGSIPPYMCKQGRMTMLLVLQNKLSGEIPPNYLNCSTLTRFRVSNNSLTGVIPSGIWGLPNLHIIDLAMNRLEGEVTSDIQNAKALAQLFIANNKFTGELPEEISRIEFLVAIDVSNNWFSGRLPRGIGELKNLSSLQMENNMFSGPIPGSLGSCDSISVVNMANNSLSGEIPASLGSLPVLSSLNLSNNRLSGSIPSSFLSLSLSMLDLSNNQLTSQIPDSLSIEDYDSSFLGNPGLCSNKFSSFRRCSSHLGMPKVVLMLVICLALTMPMCISVGFFVYIPYKRARQHQRSLTGHSWRVVLFRYLRFTKDEILNSIKQENLIGGGASGTVYRAILSDGKELAVKHIRNTGTNSRTHTTPLNLGEQDDRSLEFKAEVETLSSIRHMNVVKLYCSIKSDDSSYLVYEYLPNGNLWHRLHTSWDIELDWETRYRIAVGVGVAKGLEYLHHGLERPVLHRDIKSSNILLDEDLEPRIADFGLAKTLQVEGGNNSTRAIVGTNGYIAPEYGYTSDVNEKSDIYSFGVVLMELVTGKRPIETEFGEERDIVNWVSSKVEDE